MAQIGLGGQVLGLCGPAAGDCDPNNPNESLRPSDIDTSQELLWDEALRTRLAASAMWQARTTMTKAALRSSR